MLSEPPPGAVIVKAGFDTMFGGLGKEWVETMHAVVTGCAVAGETVLLTRLLRGRNAKASNHPDYAQTFIEKLCWKLRIDLPSGDSFEIPCVCTRRNLEIPWTCRYSEELPAHEDGSDFPFCPPEGWAEGSWQAARTHLGRPTWRDGFDCFWGEPPAQHATGMSEHWDVFLDQNVSRHEAYGMHLNIVRWRPELVNPDGARTGDIHHTAKDKKALVRKKTGWNC